ncbi:MAG TPA: alpha/beta hydrolase [Verrucomicrobiae bacterium]|nr:alpha/beta hydrolase [Verrucomicrobiae bacterium]
MKKVFYPVVLPLAALLLRPAVGAERSKGSDLVYRVPNMDKVMVHSNLVYKTAAGLPLEADVYLPQGTHSNATLPAIIFVLGDASPAVLRNAKDWEFFHSYGRLAAASGFVGITFNHRSSENFTKLPEMRGDIEDLVRYVRTNAPALSINKDQLCLWFFSGSGPHLSVGMGTNAGFVKCLVAYYPMLAVPTNVVSADIAAEYSAIKQIKRHAPRVPPMLVAKAGRDAPSLNRLIDSLRDQAKASNLPLEYLEHPKGRHAFDILDDDDTSREILRRTMSFIERHLVGR